MKKRIAFILSLMLCLLPGLPAPYGYGDERYRRRGIRQQRVGNRGDRHHAGGR